MTAGALIDATADAPPASYVGSRLPRGIGTTQLLTLRDSYKNLLHDDGSGAPLRTYAQAVLLEIECLLDSRTSRIGGATAWGS